MRRLAAEEQPRAWSDGSAEPSDPLRNRAADRSRSGTALEWLQDSKTSAIVSGLIAFTVGISVCIVNDHGFGWVTIWWLWTLPIIFGLAMYKVMSGR